MKRRTKRRRATPGTILLESIAKAALTYAVGLWLRGGGVGPLGNLLKK